MTVRQTAAALAGLALAGGACAQAYPAKPVRFIVPFATGASIELMTRVIVEEIGKRTGTVFIVESRPGALGAIGMDAVAKAAPDGYTLMPSSSATHSSGPQLTKNPMPDPVKAYTHLAAVDRFDLMLVVNAASGIKTAGELVEAGKRKPMVFGYGSATGQVGASAFLRAAGLEATGAAYKSQPLAVNDLLGGHIDFVTSDIPSVSAHIRAGKLNGLGVSSDRRSTLFPDIPTLGERGIKVELIGWVGLSGPAGLPEEVRNWWHKNIALALADPGVIEKYRQMGVEPFLLSGAPFEKFVAEQYQVWGRHIREAGIKPE